MHRRVILAFACLAIAGVVGASDDDFRVTGATGNAAVWPAGAEAPSPATDGLPLNPGDRLVTGAGGSVEVAGKNGTVFELQENSAFSIDEPTSRWTAFRLQVGRLLAKFAPSPSRPYRVGTPVAVAAIRGTELALDVSDTGALQGGVVEGEVAFEPLTESEAPASEGITGTTARPWTAESVSTSRGIEIAPQQAPKRLAEIPPVLRPSLPAFASIRERVPRLRDNWKTLAQSERQELRRTALRDRIRWEIPPRLRDRIPSPRANLLRPSVPRREIERPARPVLRRNEPARPLRPGRRYR